MSKRRLRLPGEYIRRSLVTVEMDSLEAEMFVPEKLEAALKRRRDLDDVVVEEHTSSAPGASTTVGPSQWNTQGWLRSCLTRS